GLALASAAGYTLSRSRFLRRGSAFGRALLAQLLPSAILLTALCLALGWLGLFDSYLALLIVYFVTMLPFCIWQMKRNYDAISLSFEEAAEIDGASAWQSFSRILLPLGMPALVVTGLFSLFAAWNESVIGAILLRNSSTFPLPILERGFQFPPALSSALLVSIPAILVFVVLSRFLIASLHSGVANN
ncbi:MAG TPA: carbohydrate ABC transporter permease, partial [Chthoniobacteraceae bacterium]|nr:carbohydrate ABC transporter permease [Chthoniobacteraceae bacterium]